MNDYGTGSAPAPDFNDRDAWFRAARQRVQIPGLLLQVFGIISLFLSVLNFALVFAAPEVRFKNFYDAMANMQKDQPGAQKMPPFDEWVKSQQVMAGILGVVQLAGSVIMFLGGARMKHLQSYGLSMTAAIIGTIPLCTNQCCCISTPFGIWALVVLLNPDVKLAFTRAGEMLGDRDVPRDDRPLDEDWDSRRGDDGDRRDDYDRR